MREQKIVYWISNNERERVSKIKKVIELKSKASKK